MREVASGVVVFDNPFGGSNVTAITSEEGTILVDSSLFPSKAEEIRLYVNRLLHSEIMLVINTHYHPDHTFGNSGFKTNVLCCEETEKYFERMDSAYLESIFSRDEELRKERVLIVPPFETFRDSYEIKFGGYTIYLERVGGHTPDSTIVKIPDKKVVICGDLVINGYHPEIVSDSDIREWVKVLKSIKREKYSHIICGHGDVSRDSEIDRMRLYLEKMLMIHENRGDIENIIYNLREDSNFRNRKMNEIFLESLKYLLAEV